MNNKDWLDKVILAEKVYSEGRLHTNFQQDELLKFIKFLHETYGIEYEKPEARHDNMPHKKVKQ